MYFCHRLIKKYTINNSGKILVTGATGLVGKHLIRRIGASKNVIALSRSGADVEGAKGVACDILDVALLEEVMQGVEKVYHCAAIVSFHKEQQEEIYRINVDGTANVVNACIDAGVKKLVYVSSVAALGEPVAGETVTEKNVYAGKGSFYGKTKYLAEMETWRGFAEGLDIVAVNPSIILGASDWTSGSTQLFKNVYEEFPYYTEGIHGYVDVHDVAEAMVQMMESDISGEKFILNSENISFKELFTLMANAFGKKVPSKKATPLMSEIVWRLSYLSAKLKGKKSLLTKETARSAQTTVFYDNSKILKALPDFTFTPLSETIERIAGELKEKYQLK